MKYIHLAASIITVLTGLYTLSLIFSKSETSEKKRPNLSRLLNILSGIIVSAALIFTAGIAIENQYPGTLKPKWTAEESIMIPPSGREGRFISGKLEMSFPKGTHLIEVKCYYPDTNRTKPVVFVPPNPSDAEGVIECVGAHKKHDNKRALNMSVCYSRFKGRKCPPKE